MSLHLLNVSNALAALSGKPDPHGVLQEAFTCLKFGTALKHFLWNSVTWTFLLFFSYKNHLKPSFFISVLGMGRTGFKSYPPQWSY